MTEQELTDLIGKRRLTDRLALELSIKKWAELPKYWDELTKLKRASDHYPVGKNCALCVMNERRGQGGCKDCPLIEGIMAVEFSWNEERFYIGCAEGSSYRQAENAIDNDDKANFMAARKNLLRRMRRALAKLKPVRRVRLVVEE